MKKFRKSLSILLVAAMVLGMMPETVMVAEATASTEGSAVKVSVSYNGTEAEVTVSSGNENKITVSDGDEVGFTAAPENGYKIVSINVYKAENGVKTNDADDSDGFTPLKEEKYTFTPNELKGANNKAATELVIDVVTAPIPEYKVAFEVSGDDIFKEAIADLSYEAKLDKVAGANAEYKVKKTTVKKASTATVREGSKVTLTFTPDSRYENYMVYVDKAAGVKPTLDGGVYKYEIASVAKDTTIKVGATAKPKTEINITVSANDAVAVEYRTAYSDTYAPVGSGFKAVKDVDFWIKATPKKYYQVAKMVVSGSDVEGTKDTKEDKNGTAYKFKLDAASAINVTFAKRELANQTVKFDYEASKVSVSANGLTAENTVTAKEGNDITFKVAPKAGYRVKYVGVNPNDSKTNITPNENGEYTYTVDSYDAGEKGLVIYIVAGEISEREISITYNATRTDVTDIKIGDTAATVTSVSDGDTVKKTFETTAEVTFKVVDKDGYVSHVSDGNVEKTDAGYKIAAGYEKLNIEVVSALDQAKANKIVVAKDKNYTIKVDVPEDKLLEPDEDGVTYYTDSKKFGVKVDAISEDYAVAAVNFDPAVTYGNKGKVDSIAVDDWAQSFSTDADALEMGEDVKAVKVSAVLKDTNGCVLKIARPAYANEITYTVKIDGEEAEPTVQGKYFVYEAGSRDVISIMPKAADHVVLTTYTFDGYKCAELNGNSHIEAVKEENFVTSEGINFTMYGDTTIEVNCKRDIWVALTLNGKAIEPAKGVYSVDFEKTYTVEAYQGLETRIPVADTKVKITKVKYGNTTKTNADDVAKHVKTVSENEISILADTFDQSKKTISAEVTVKGAAEPFKLTLEAVKVPTSVTIKDISLPAATTKTITTRNFVTITPAGADANKLKLKFPAGTVSGNEPVDIKFNGTKITVTSKALKNSAYAAANWPMEIDLLDEKDTKVGSVKVTITKPTTNINPTYKATNDTTDTELAVQLNPAKSNLAAVQDGSLWYRVSIKDKKGNAVCVSGNDTDGVYFVPAETSKGKYVATNWMVKVINAEEGEGEAKPFDLSVESVWLTGEYETPAEAKAAYGKGTDNDYVIKSDKVEKELSTKAPYYETKLKVNTKGKVKTVYTTQKDAEVAVPVYSPATTFRRIAKIEDLSWPDYRYYDPVNDEYYYEQNPYALSFDDEKMRENSITASATSMTALGKHKIKVTAYVAPGAVPATATFTVTVAKGIEDITLGGPTLVYKKAKTKANWTPTISFNKYTAQPKNKKAVVWTATYQGKPVSNTNGDRKVSINKKTGKITVGKFVEVSSGDIENRIFVTAQATDFAGNTVKSTRVVTLTNTEAVVGSVMAVKKVVSGNDYSYEVVAKDQAEVTSDVLLGAQVVALKEASDKKTFGEYELDNLIIDPSTLTFKSSSTLVAKIDATGKITSVSKVDKNVKFTATTKITEKTGNKKPAASMTVKIVKKEAPAYGLRVFDENGNRIALLDASKKEASISVLKGMPFYVEVVSLTVPTVTNGDASLNAYSTASVNFKDGVDTATAINKKVDAFGYKQRIVAKKDTVVVNVKDSKSSSKNITFKLKMNVGTKTLGNVTGTKVTANTWQTATFTLTSSDYEFDKQNTVVYIYPDGIQYKKAATGAKYDKFLSAANGWGTDFSGFYKPVWTDEDSSTFTINFNGNQASGNYKLYACCGTLDEDGKFKADTVAKAFSLKVNSYKLKAAKPKMSAKYNVSLMDGATVKLAVSGTGVDGGYWYDLMDAVVNKDGLKSDGTVKTGMSKNGSISEFTKYFEIRNGNTLRLKADMAEKIAAEALKGNDEEFTLTGYVTCEAYSKIGYARPAAKQVKITVTICPMGDKYTPARAKKKFTYTGVTQTVIRQKSGEGSDATYSANAWIGVNNYAFDIANAVIDSPKSNENVITYSVGNDFKESQNYSGVSFNISGKGVKTGDTKYTMYVLPAGSYYKSKVTNDETLKTYGVPVTGKITIKSETTAIMKSPQSVKILASSFVKNVSGNDYYEQDFYPTVDTKSKVTQTPWLESIGPKEDKDKKVVSFKNGKVKLDVVELTNVVNDNVWDNKNKTYDVKVLVKYEGCAEQTVTFKFSLPKKPSDQTGEALLKAIPDELAMNKSDVFSYAPSMYSVWEYDEELKKGIYVYKDSFREFSSYYDEKGVDKYGNPYTSRHWETVTVDYDTFEDMCVAYAMKLVEQKLAKAYECGATTKPTVTNGDISDGDVTAGDARVLIPGEAGVDVPVAKRDVTDGYIVYTFKVSAYDTAKKTDVTKNVKVKRPALPCDLKAELAEKAAGALNKNITNAKDLADYLRTELQLKGATKALAGRDNLRLYVDTYYTAAPTDIYPDYTYATVYLKDIRTGAGMMIDNSYKVKKDKLGGYAEAKAALKALETELNAENDGNGMDYTFTEEDLKLMIIDKVASVGNKDLRVRLVTFKTKKATAGEAGSIAARVYIDNDHATNWEDYKYPVEITINLWKLTTATEAVAAIKEALPYDGKAGQNAEKVTEAFEKDILAAAKETNPAAYMKEAVITKAKSVVNNPDLSVVYDVSGNAANGYFEYNAPTYKEAGSIKYKIVVSGGDLIDDAAKVKLDSEGALTKVIKLQTPKQALADLTKDLKNKKVFNENADCTEKKLLELIQESVVNPDIDIAMNLKVVESTKDDDGSVTGTVVLTLGDDTETYNFSAKIKFISFTKEQIEEAILKAVSGGDVTSGDVADDTSKAKLAKALVEKVNKVLSKDVSVGDADVTWGTADPATVKKTGKITVTFVPKRNGEAIDGLASVECTLIIAVLPQDLDQAKAAVEAAIGSSEFAILAADVSGNGANTDYVSGGDLSTEAKGKIKTEAENALADIYEVAGIVTVTSINTTDTKFDVKITITIKVKDSDKAADKKDAVITKTGISRS